MTTFARNEEADNREAHASPTSAAPPPRHAHELLQLQRQAGNRAVTALLARQRLSHGPGASIATEQTAVVDALVAAASPLVGTGAAHDLWQALQAQIARDEPSATLPPTAHGSLLEPVLTVLYGAPLVAHLREIKRLAHLGVNDAEGDGRTQRARGEILARLYDRLGSSIRATGALAAPTTPADPAADTTAERAVGLHRLLRAGWAQNRRALLGVFGALEVGPREAIRRMNAYYGQLQTTMFLGQHVTLVHPLMIAALTRAENELVRRLGRAPAEALAARRIGSIGGFNIRTNRNNAAVLSDHSFGWAIDIRPEFNPNVRSDRLDAVEAVTGVNVFNRASAGTDPAHPGESPHIQANFTTGLSYDDAFAEATRLAAASTSYTTAFASATELDNRVTQFITRARAAEHLPALPAADAAAIVTAARAPAATPAAIAALMFPAGAVPRATAERRRHEAALVLRIYAISRQTHDSTGAVVRPEAIGTAGSVAAHGFMDVPPEIVAALINPGGLVWLGSTRGTHDYMHFELPSPPDLNVPAEAQVAPAAAQVVPRPPARVNDPDPPELLPAVRASGIEMPVVAAPRGASMSDAPPILARWTDAGAAPPRRRREASIAINPPPAPAAGWNATPQDVGSARRIPIEGITLGNQQPDRIDATGEAASDAVADNAGHGRAIVVEPSTVTASTRTVDVLLHLHGHNVGYRQRANDNTVRDIALDRIEQQVEASSTRQGRPLIAILPQGTHGSNFNVAHHPAFAPVPYVSEVLRLAAPHLRCGTPQLGELILSGHSGASFPIAEMLRAGADPHGLMLFDALNGARDSGAVERWLRRHLDADVRALTAGTTPPSETQQRAYLEHSARMMAYFSGGYSRQYAGLVHRRDEWFRANAARLGGPGSTAYRGLWANYQVGHTHRAPNATGGNAPHEGIIGSGNLEEGLDAMHGFAPAGPEPMPARRVARAPFRDGRPRGAPLPWRQATGRDPDFEHYDHVPRPPQPALDPYHAVAASESVGEPVPAHRRNDPVDPNSHDRWVTHSYHFDGDPDVSFRTGVYYGRFRPDAVDTGGRTTAPQAAEFEGLHYESGEAVTEAEARAFAAMSRHEGDYGNVNTYDRGLVSYGIFQAAASSSHLQRMLLSFKQESESAQPSRGIEPGSYQRLLGRYGIDVIPGPHGDRDPQIVIGPPARETPIAGAAAITELQHDLTLIAILIHAGRDPSMQAAQRLAGVRNELQGALHARVAGHRRQDYLPTIRGMALAVDRQVNRPGADVPVIDAAIRAVYGGIDPTTLSAAERERRAGEVLRRCLTTWATRRQAARSAIAAIVRELMPDERTLPSQATIQALGSQRRNAWVARFNSAASGWEPADLAATRTHEIMTGTNPATYGHEATVSLPPATSATGPLGPAPLPRAWTNLRDLVRGPR